MATIPAVESSNKQIKYISETLAWSLRLIVAFAAACLIIGYRSEFTMLQTIGFLSVGYSVAILGKMWLLKRGWHQTMVLVLAIDLSIFGLGLTITTFLALPIIVLFPIIIYICSSIFLSGRALAWVNFFALAMCLATCAARIVLNMNLPYHWFGGLMVLPAVLVTQAIVLLLAWQSRQYQTSLLAQSQVAHTALQNLHNRLEQTVEERTRELSQTVSLLRATLDSTTDGIVVVDNAQQVIAWNRRFVDMWHLQDEVFAGCDIKQLRHHVADQLYNPETFVKQAQEMYKRADAKSQDTLLFKDGRVFERNSQPQTIDDTIVGRVMSFRDITEQVKSQERATAFAALGQELSATVTVEDAARTILAVADELFGWDASYLDFYNPEDQTLQTIVCIDTIGDQQVEMPLPSPSKLSFNEHQIIRNGAQLVLREPQQPDPGEFVPFGDTNRPSASLMFAPILRGNATVGVLSVQSYTYNAYTETDLATFQNLANHCAGALDRNRSEAALRRAEEQRQQLERKMLETQKRESLGILAGGIAHDFNNLLTVMQGNMALVRLDLDPDHPALESLQQAELATRRAADLTRQMLAYAGKGQLAVGEVALNDLVREMRDLLRTSLPKHIPFEYQFGDALPWIEADSTQLRQVIMNLIVNAGEAIGDSHGSVVVRTQLVTVSQADLADAAVGSDISPGVFVSLDIEDTGSGMESTTLRRMFEPFFTTKFTGRGLGLAAVLGIVRNHHGAIRVQSEVGRGTHFQVLLPPAKQIVPAAPPAEPDSPWHYHGTALIIDDEPAIRNLVGRMVTQLGITPHAVDNGDAAVVAYGEIACQTSIVLLDLTMPGLSAQETLQALHAIRPDVPIVLMSGYSEQDAQSLLRHPQVVGFLHKPFRLSELRDSIRQALTT